MKRHLGWMIGFLFIAATTGTMADGPAMELDPAAPLARQAIQLAAPEAERRGLDVRNYQTTVYSVGEELIILFRNPGPRPAGFRGDPGPLPEFKVEVDAEASRIIKSDFVLVR